MSMLSLWRRGVATVVLGAPAFALGVTGCGGGTARFTGGAADTVFVGVAVGLQSPERYVNVYKGVQLALDDLNASRPASAPFLALRRAPENAKSPVAVAEALRDDRRVIGVVGHTESGPTIDAAAIYDDREHDGGRALAAVSPTAGAPGVTLASPWVFRVCPVVDRQAEVLARYMTDSLGLKRVGLIYRNDVSGRDFVRSVSGYTARGFLVARDPFVEEIAEFELYAQRLARSRPDGVMVFGNASDVLKVMRALHAAGISPVVISTNGPSASELAQDPQAARDFAGLRYLSLYSPAHATTPVAQRFAASFERRFGAAPDHWAALSYDAAMLIGLAVHAVGPDRHRVRDWIAAVGQGQPVFQGATGTIRFDGSRNPVSKAAGIAVVGQ